MPAISDGSRTSSGFEPSFVDSQASPQGFANAPIEGDHVLVLRFQERPARPGNRGGPA